MEINLDARPRLLRGVKLKFDAARNRWVLLAPERVITLNASATEILKRCTGDMALAQIIDDLSKKFRAEHSIIECDARTLLWQLRAKRMVEL